MAMIVEPTFTGGKRPRTEFARRTKRPIDKFLKAVTLTGIDNTQQDSTLLTVTFPCTVTGLRWNLAHVKAAGAGDSRIYWAIVVAPDGETANTLGISDGAQFFEPEQNCLVFGHSTIIVNGGGTLMIGSTKTMRKMRGGDVLTLIALGNVTDTSDLTGVVQFFCKT